MKIYVTSQYMENYGDELTPHWKCKGGYTVFCNAENGRSDLYYLNIADKLLEMAVFSNTHTSAYNASIEIMEDNKEHYYEKMYRENGDIYKADKIVTEAELFS